MWSIIPQKSEHGTTVDKTFFQDAADAMDAADSLLTEWLGKLFDEVKKEGLD